MKLARLGRKVTMLAPRLGSQTPQDKPWQKTALSAKRKTGRAGVADRERIRQRDKWICQECGQITPDLHVDHIVPLAEGGTDTDSNKRCLCIPCHDRKTAIESARGAGR